MGKITKAISDELATLCQNELKKHGIRGKTGRRLQAILSAKKHGIVKVAEIYNMSRETLRNWINRFKEEGSEGFAVKPGRGRRSKLTTEQKLTLKDYIEQAGATPALRGSSTK